jgi:adenine phosphoribosyltransferase
MMKRYLSRVDRETTGNRNDVTPLFANAEDFSQLVLDLAEPFLQTDVDCVACIDALGFILGTALARHLDVGLIPVRKGGKLPVPTDSIDFRDYSGDLKRLEIRKSILSPGSRILLVDEWIETGSQIMAAAELIEGQDGIIVGIATINMDKNKQTSSLSRKYRVHSVWED